MTANTIEPASSGRAKCRGCRQPIAKGELRLGERLPNPFADKGDLTLWFHLVCGAYKRPEALLMALEACEDPIEREDWLLGEAKRGIEHHRLPRVDGAERASTGRSKCRGCHAKIAADEWRIRLIYFDEGMAAPSGFLHPACAREYLGTADLLDRLEHFGAELSPEDKASLEEALASSPEAGEQA